MTILSTIGAAWCLFTPCRAAQFIWIDLRESRDGNSARWTNLREWEVDHSLKSTTTGL